MMGDTVAEGWGVENGEASGTGAITAAGVAVVSGVDNTAGVAVPPFGATTVGSAPAGTAAAGAAAVVTWKSGIDFCTVWYTPHASGTPATSQ